MEQQKMKATNAESEGGAVPGKGGALFEEFIASKVITLATLLRRASTLRFHRMFELGLVEWRVLIRIGTSGPLSLNDVADHVGLAKSQISRVVTKLVERKLVSRKQNPKRSREVELTLTAKGRELHKGIIAAGLIRNSELTADLDPAQLTATHRVIAELTERAREFLAQEQALVADATPPSDADLMMGKY
ncbi:MarR family winged helix-turn-helix transcriptional regulator [Allosphingosinicella humi]|jgi:DNA-binding MarR family transcriptional regulator